MNGKQPAFDPFCREAFAFLEASGVRYLVIGGLAVMAIGEARLTADADVVAYLTERDADALIRKAKSAGFDVDPRVERASLPLFKILAGRDKDLLDAEGPPASRIFGTFTS